MDNRPLVELVVVAALILVLLPLFAATAMITAHFGFGMTGMTGIFGPMGATHALMLLWTVFALVIVGALVALVVNGAAQA